MLVTEPYMDPKFNMQIEMIYSLVLSQGISESIMLILNLISENELPEIEGFSTANFAEIIMTKTIITNDTKLLKKIFSIVEQLSLSYDDVSSIFLEKLKQIMIKFVRKEGDPKQIQSYKFYVVWSIAQYVEWMANMQPENVEAGAHCFSEIFDDADYSMQMRIAKSFALLDNSVIKEEKIINVFCKFISSDDCGVYCIAKLNSILTTPSHPLAKYTLEQCIEIEDEIDDLLSSSNEQVAENVTQLCETIESLK